MKKKTQSIQNDQQVIEKFKHASRFRYLVHVLPCCALQLMFMGLISTLVESICNKNKVYWPVHSTFLNSQQLNQQFLLENISTTAGIPRYFWGLLMALLPQWVLPCAIVVLMASFFMEERNPYCTNVFKGRCLSNSHLR